MKVLTDVQNCNVRFITLRIIENDVGAILPKMDSQYDYTISLKDVGRKISTLIINNEIRSTIFFD